MTILSFDVNVMGQTGESPALAYISTTNTVAEILTSGFLNSFISNNPAIGTGDMCLIRTMETPSSEQAVAWYAITKVGVNYVLAPANSPFPVVTVPFGGTGLSTASPYRLLAGGVDATANLQYVTAGSAGQVLMSNGASALPTWEAAPGGVASVSGTANRITSTGGTDPVIDIAANYVGQTSIVHLGAIIEGSWTSSATKIGLTSGGTNTSLTAAAGGIVYSTSTGMGISTVGTTGEVLVSGGTGAPTWTAPTYPVVVGAVGTLLRSDGTNWVATTSTYPNTNTVNTLLYASSANVMSALATANSGVLVTSAGGVPSISGTLPFTVPVSTGGTGLTSTTANQILYSSATSVIGGITATARSVLANNSTGVPGFVALTDGQLVVGSTAGSPAAATLTAGTGITITNASNSITISASTGGFTWNNVTGTSASMAIENGYGANNAGLVTLTLPVTAAQFTEIQVAGIGAGGWTIAQNANQLIHVGSVASTTGVGGSVSSTNRYDQVTLLCVVANTEWVVTANFGALAHV